MYKRQGNSAAAIEHFKTAAQSESETGKKATIEMVVLDLEANPANYIASRAAVDDNGRVWAQFLNRTGVPVRDLEISYMWLDEQGQTRQAKKTYAGPLQGGKQDQLELGVTLSNPADLNRRVRVEIIGARIAR